MQPFRDDQFYRLKHIVQPHGKFPICASSWWAGVKSGRYPKPIKLGPKISVWQGSVLNSLVTDVD
ncbi:helix-turn-helix transcriptional regulator [Tardiphaga sp. 20_F10_N6_6]|uniref:helix-turn-helix transcriptional regulator n=1 Tax=Tardiphaga sp. 20_F10_N6_6 TaxID=3240788 RepID=UPI003F8B4094